MRIFTVEEPIFKTATLFVVDCSFDVFAAHLKRRYRMETGEFMGQVGQMFTFQKPPFRVVWTATRDMAVLLHETFHLVTRVCEDRGIPIKAHGEHGDSQDEPAAFLFEFFARALLKRKWLH